MIKILNYPDFIVDSHFEFPTRTFKFHPVTKLDVNQIEHCFSKTAF